MKKDAEACGPRHGAASGTVVRVKLSVDGKTGRVLESTAQEEHQDTPLGRCVAAVFATIELAPFRAARFGMLYSLRTK